VGVEVERRGAEHARLVHLRRHDAQLLDDVRPRVLAQALAHAGGEERHGEADRAAEHDQPGVVGVERESDRVAELEAELAEEREGLAIAGPGAREDLLAGHARLAQEERAGAVVLDRVVTIGDGADLSRAAVVAAVETPVDDDAGAEPGADGEADQVANAAAGAEVELADGERVGVVVDVGGHAVALLQVVAERHLAPGGDVLHPIDDAAVEVDDARHATADAGHLAIEDLVDGAEDLRRDHLGPLAVRDARGGAALDGAAAHLADADLGAAEVDAQDGGGGSGGVD